MAKVYRFTGRRVRHIDFAQQRPKRNWTAFWTLAMLYVGMPPVTLLGMTVLGHYTSVDPQIRPDIWPYAVGWAFLSGGVFVKWWQSLQ